MGIFDKDKLKNVGAGIKNAWDTAWENYHNYNPEKDKNAGKPVWEDPGQSGDMKSVYDKIMGRGAFQYDLNGDALYQQLRQTYAKQGQLGAMNAIGNAAALSGGFGNSYAAAAGQQAYQQSLEGLNAHIPDLYAMALQQYQAESDRLLQQYQVADSDRAFQYQKYRDDMGDWTDERNFNYQKERDEVADKQWQAELDERSSEFQQELSFKQSQAKAENERWQQQFGYQQFLDERNYKYQVSRDERADMESDRAYDYQLGRAARADYESDRDYDRGVLESDRNFNRSIYESDRDYNRGVLESDREWNASEDQRSKDNAYRDFMTKVDLQKDARDWNYQDQMDRQAQANWAAEMAQKNNQIAWGQKMDLEDLKYKYAALGLRYG